MKELAATGAGAGEIRAPAAARAGEASPQSSPVQSSRAIESETERAARSAMVEAEGGREGLGRGI